MSFQLKQKKGSYKLPLFQAFLFLLSVLLSLFTRNGPSSCIAPLPSDEHPGPAVDGYYQVNYPCILMH